MGLSLPGVAQQVPVFRIGVIDNEFGPLTKGARLAVQHINDAGGVIGADGTTFRLELAVQPPDNIETSIANLRQANIIALIGPENSEDVLNNLNILTSLQVPVLTPAMDDAIIARDASGLIFRTRAQEIVVGRSLASYLVNDLNLNRIITVQLDVQSTGGVFGLTRSLSELGVTPEQALLLEQDTQVDDLVQDISTANPPFLAIYGPPATARVLYTELRNTGWAGRLIYNQAVDPLFRASLPVELQTGIIGATSWLYGLNTSISEDFVVEYLQLFGEVATPTAASIYDAINLIADSVQLPGNLADNLTATADYPGVQGTLNPATLSAGELSDNAIVYQIGVYAAPEIIARYQGTTRLPLSSEPDGGIDTGIIPPTATPQPTATPEGVVVTVESAVQNVRTGPGLNYDVIGQLQRGDQARVIGTSLNADWVIIDFRGQRGWMATYLLDVFGDLNTVAIINPPPTPTPRPPTPTPTAAPVADIVITNAIPNRLPTDAPFNVIVTVRNQGLLDAGQFAVAATFEPGGAYAGVNVPGLAAGQQTTVTLTGSLSGPTGPQQVTIIADLNNQVNEGSVGEANNDDYSISYVADRSALITSSVTLGVGGTIDLDTPSGTIDLSWDGNQLSALNGAQIYILSNVSSLDEVHHDMISTTTNSSPIPGSILGGAYVGYITNTGDARRGVLRVDNVIISGATGQITFTYRTYN